MYMWPQSGDLKIHSVVITTCFSSRYFSSSVSIFHLWVGRSHDRPSTRPHSGTDISAESWSLSPQRTEFLGEKYMN